MRGPTMDWVRELVCGQNIRHAANKSINFVNMLKSSGLGLTFDPQTVSRTISTVLGDVSLPSQYRCDFQAYRVSLESVHCITLQADLVFSSHFITLIKLTFSLNNCTPDIFNDFH